MFPVLYQHGGLTFYSFGTMVALGALAAFAVGSVELRRRATAAWTIPVILCTVAVASFAGARGLAALLDRPAVPADGWTGGLSAVGAILFGGVAVVLVGRLQPLAPLALLDALAPAAALGEAFARIGCHLAGDGHWGPPTALPWGVSYRAAIVGWDPAWPPVHPTPLYESAAAAAVFVVLRRQGGHPAGWVVSLYLILAGGARFLLGFLRADPGRVAGLDASQLVAALGVVLGTLGLLRLRRRAIVGRPSLQASVETGG
jgi:phosphatidylglycerol---prolipoprotein diacylglyceryl transferase